MAKVNFKGIQKVQSTIRKEIVKELRKKETRQEFGALVIRGIKDTTLGAPKDSTLKWRERYDRLNNTDKSYQRNKINLTFTGDLLEDLKNNIRVNATGKQVAFEIENSNKKHRKYQGVTKKIGSRSAYSKIQEGLNNMGYRYPFIDKNTLKDLNKLITTILRASLRKTFKV